MIKCEIVLCLFICIYACSPSNKQTDHIDYLAFVGKAELAYLSGNIENSYNLYDVAFQCESPFFAKDIYNFLVVSLLVNNHSNIPFLLDELSNRGISESFLKRSVLISEYLEKSGIKFENSAHCQTNLLSQKINNALEKDQESRARGYTFKTTIADSLNYELLKEVLSNGTLPDEKQLIYCDSITYFNSLHFLIWHQRSYGKNIEYLIQRIDSSLKFGSIHPNVAAKLIWILNNGQSALSPQLSFYVGYGDEKSSKLLDGQYTYAFSKDSIIQINKERKKYLMEDYETQLSKLKLIEDDSLLIWYYPKADTRIFNDSTSLFKKLNSGDWIKW